MLVAVAARARLASVERVDLEIRAENLKVYRSGHVGAESRFGMTSGRCSALSGSCARPGVAACASHWGSSDDHGARLKTTDRGRQTVGRPPRAQSRINGGCAGSTGVIACPTDLAQG